MSLGIKIETRTENFHHFSAEVSTQWFNVTLGAGTFAVRATCRSTAVQLTENYVSSDRANGGLTENIQLGIEAAAMVAPVDAAEAVYREKIHYEDKPVVSLIGITESQ